MIYSTSSFADTKNPGGFYENRAPLLNRNQRAEEEISEFVGTGPASRKGG
jgi:hypothetical protein